MVSTLRLPISNTGPAGLTTVGFAAATGAVATGFDGAAFVTAATGGFTTGAAALAITGIGFMAILRYKGFIGAVALASGFVFVYSLPLLTGCRLRTQSGSSGMISFGGSGLGFGLRKERSLASFI